MPQTSDGHAPLAAVSWSGGKDACLALHRARADFQFSCAIPMMAETGERSRSHGLRRDVMQAQIDALGLRWVTRDCTWDAYEDVIAGVDGWQAQLETWEVAFVVVPASDDAFAQRLTTAGWNAVYTDADGSVFAAPIR